MKKFRIYQACTTLAAIATVAIASGAGLQVPIAGFGGALPRSGGRSPRIFFCLGVRAMRFRSVRLYCEFVFLAGCLAMALLVGDAHLRYITDDPVTFGILGVGVVLGEMMPIKIPRRGDDEKITLSAVVRDRAAAGRRARVPR